MKRFVCLTLFFCLILAGCDTVGVRVNDPVNFYFVRKDYQKDMQQVIAAEVREASGHMEDLVYLLALYSMGPVTEDLRSPLPTNAVIVPTEHTADGLTLTLSESAYDMSDMDFTLSSTCIAMTCMDLMDLPQVTVICGDRSIAIRDDNLLLDNIPNTKPQEETQ